MKTRSRTHDSNWRAATALIATIACVVLFSLPAFPMARSLANDEGGIELEYTSHLPGLSSGNSLYSLADARFGVYVDYQCTQKAGELITDESGHARLSNLHPGRYFVREELASPGFVLSTHLQQVDVAVGASTCIKASAAPVFAAPELLIREINAETGNAADVAGARLGNARYVISHFDSFDDDKIIAGPTRSWTFTSDENGEVLLSREHLVEGSPLYEGPHGLLVLPLGHYTVTLEHAPAGFSPVNDVLSFDIATRDRTEVEPLLNFEPLEETLAVMRGDVMFRKVDEAGMTLSGIPFLLSYANGEGPDLIESHVLVTNEHGDFTSSAERIPHTIDTNRSDAAILANIDGVYKLDETKLTSACGTWFSMDAMSMTSPADDTRGALPYGSYLLQELPCAANAGTNLISTQFSINRDNFTVKLDNIVNTRPGVSGSATDAADADKLIRPIENAIVSESIDYRNLVIAKSYRVNCSAFVQSTGESVPGSDGTPAFTSQEFVAQRQNGKLDMQVTLDTSKLAGENIILRVELVSDDGMSITSEGADTAEQTLSVEPIIIATAQDAADLDNYVMGADAAIMECISYDGLKPGQSYTASCTLNDKATGNALRDAQGKVIFAHAEFTPDASEGHVDMELPVDTTGIAGHDIVVFDKLTDEEGHLIASHQDLEDERQTVKTVKLSSSATDKSDGDKVFDAHAEAVTIIDTVSYANLVPGEQYRFKGVLMDKETGCALTANGAPVSAEVPFVPQEVSGSVDVEYGFDASAQSSQVLVAFETLEHDGNVVAEHADLEDVAQTVTSGELDPDAAIPTTDGKSTGIATLAGSPLTGDFLARVALAALTLVACVCVCCAYALHRRRKTLEAIAHSDDPFR